MVRYNLDVALTRSVSTELIDQAHRARELVYWLVRSLEMNTTWRKFLCLRGHRPKARSSRASARRYVGGRSSSTAYLPVSSKLSEAHPVSNKSTLAIEREAKRYFQSILANRKANIAAFEAEAKERREALAVLETALAKRKERAAAWEADLKKWKPGKTRRKPD